MGIYVVLVCSNRRLRCESLLKLLLLLLVIIVQLACNSTNFNFSFGLGKAGRAKYPMPTHVELHTIRIMNRENFSRWIILRCFWSRTQSKSDHLHDFIIPGPAGIISAGSVLILEEKNNIFNK